MSSSASKVVVGTHNIKTDKSIFSDRYNYKVADPGMSGEWHEQVVLSAGPASLPTLTKKSITKVVTAAGTDSNDNTLPNILTLPIISAADDGWVIDCRVRCFIAGKDQVDVWVRLLAASGVWTAPSSSANTTATVTNSVLTIAEDGGVSADLGIQSGDVCVLEIDLYSTTSKPYPEVI